MHQIHRPNVQLIDRDLLGDIGLRQVDFLNRCGHCPEAVCFIDHVHRVWIYSVYIFLSPGLLYWPFAFGCSILRPKTTHSFARLLKPTKIYAEGLHSGRHSPGRPSRWSKPRKIRKRRQKRTPSRTKWFCDKIAISSKSCLVLCDSYLASIGCSCVVRWYWLVGPSWKPLR